MRLFLTIAAIHVLLAGLVVAGGGVCLWHSYHAPGPSTKPHLFLVPFGTPLGVLASDLERQGLITNETLFKFLARLKDRHTQIKAGEYDVPAHVSMADILDILVEGKSHQRLYTIPEGLTSWEIVQLLGEVEFLKGEITDIPPEGTLLPNSYAYLRADSREGEIGKMQQAMTAALTELWSARASDLPLKTPADAVILASIVEKETGVSGERAKVAGVFINRLRIGMALQTDPTVIYALTKGRPAQDGKGPLGRRILRKDLAYDSPYNTYLYPGLPPGPIANPGRAALEATLNPEEHEYLYFVADGTGGHAFARTLAEHNRNVAKWRKIRRSQNTK